MNKLREVLGLGQKSLADVLGIHQPKVYTDYGTEVQQPKASLVPGIGIVPQNMIIGNPMFQQTNKNLTGASKLATAGILADMALPGTSKIAGELAKGVSLFSKLPGAGIVSKAKNVISKSKKIKTPEKLEDIWNKAQLQEAKKYKSADEFVKAQSLYHGTPAKLEGNKLSFGKGDIKKGGQSGGLFLTDNSNSAKTFAFGGEIYQATPSIKNQVIDLTKKEGINKFKEFIGKSYKTMEGDMVTFDKYSFDNMFPNGKADFASISQFPELVEKIVKENKLKGIAFNEYAGGEIGKTYQILSGDIPVYTKSQLIDIWNKAHDGFTTIGQTLKMAGILGAGAIAYPKLRDVLGLGKKNLADVLGVEPVSDTIHQQPE